MISIMKCNLQVGVVIIPICGKGIQLLLTLACKIMQVQPGTVASW